MLEMWRKVRTGGGKVEKRVERTRRKVQQTGKGKVRGGREEEGN